MLALLAVSIVAASASAEIKSVETQFRAAESFIRIAEYLTGEPSEGPELVARTQPQDRTGLYFRVVLTAPVEAMPNLASAEISVLGVDSPEPMNYRLSLAPGGARSAVMLLGLTGEDWPDDPDAPHPTAWRVQLLDAGGNVLAEHRSFLWGTR